MGSSQNLPINGQDAVSSPDPTRKKRKNRRGRGSTFLPDIIKDRSSGIRKVVKYNRRGQPIGSEKFSSYLGVLARTMVPIHRTWKKVSNEDKEMLWKCVQIQLMKKSVEGAKDEFVEGEGVDTQPFEVIDRSVLWQLSRQNKNGEYDNEAIKEQAALIDEFTRQAQEGNLSLGGRTDILALVLGNNERSGKVRGVGDFVTPTAYFHTPRRGGHSHCEEMIKALQTAMSEMKGQFNAMSQQIPHTPQSDYVSSNTIRSCNIDSPQLNPMKMKNMVRTQNDIPPDPKPKTKKSQPCKLAVGSLDNIVAHGTMFEKLGPEEPLHTVPLGDANFRVCIDFVIEKDVILPVPIPGEVNIVGEATGYHVAWPKNLILLGNEGVSKNNEVAGNKATLRNVDSDKILESLRSFDDYVETVEYNEAYTITLDEDLFGPNVELPIQREDMEHVSQMKELSLACIMLYMNHLFRVIKSANLERKFLFINPSAISGTTKQLIGGSKSALLASLLKDAENDQLVFIPHVTGFHWILFVIDLSYPIVYYLDSLHGSVHQNLKLILSTAIKLHDNAKNLKRILAWKEVECPMQPTNVECGFYVMRFMKDLIADRSILSKRDFNGKKTYTQAEIDEVRVEWMNFILELDI